MIGVSNIIGVHVFETGATCQKWVDGHVKYLKLAIVRVDHTL